LQSANRLAEDISWFCRACHAVDAGGLLGRLLAYFFDGPSQEDPATGLQHYCKRVTRGERFVPSISR